MGKMFEVLDDQATPLGDLMLRRRMVPLLEAEDTEVYEVILNGEFLMSSLFHVVEVALADRGLALAGSGLLDVVVGGLGLGYTAAAVLAHANVRTLRVIDIMEPVIRWHKTGLVPLAPQLVQDARCRLVLEDFFSWAGAPEEEAARSHAILLDIDHTPDHWLNPSHAAFYSTEGLKTLARHHLHSEGVFALWSDAAPEKKFLEKLRTVFAEVRADVVTFPNPLRGGESSGTVYLAKFE